MNRHDHRDTPLTPDHSAAKLVLLRPETGLAGAAKTALLFYIHKYLEFLQSAGHHTLYDLPDFEGKFKASQNRPEADRAGVANGLLAEDGPHSAAMRELVKQRGGV